jgi:predicted kinase
MGDATLILLCGLPGAGKSTLGRRLATERPAVRLAPDEWISRLGLDHWDEATRDKVERLLWDLAQELLRLGQSVILESGFWRRAERDEKRRVARSIGALVELHFLDVPSDELWSRIERRNRRPSWPAAPITRADLNRWVAVFQPPNTAELALFDPPPASR